MALILVAGLLFLTTVLVYIYLKRPYTLIDNQLSGAKPQVLFGNLLNSGILTGKATFCETILDYQRRYGDKFVFWFGSYPCITFCLPEHAQTILSDRNTFEQSPLFLPNFHLLCPQGLVVLAGAKWKRHIRVMLPLFRRAKVMQYLDTIVKCTDHFIDQGLGNGQIHTDLLQRCQALTMSVIGLVGFDYDLSNVDSPTRIAFHDFSYYTTMAMLMAPLPKWFTKVYLKLNRRYQRIHQHIHEITEKIVEKEVNN